MTYRARLEGTSESDSDYLATLIEAWVNKWASIIVEGILDPNCAVVISRLSEGECLSVAEESSTDNKSPSVLIGGISAAVFVFLVTGSSSYCNADSSCSGARLSFFQERPDY